VSAFGFGGTNFHAVLEEYSPSGAASGDRPAELLMFRAGSRAGLSRLVRRTQAAAKNETNVRLIDLAAILATEAAAATGQFRLAIPAAKAGGLPALLDRACEVLDQEGAVFSPSEPIFYGEGNFEHKVAFLFPGQGSQQVNMLEDLALHLPGVRRVFEAADRA